MCDIEKMLLRTQCKFVGKCQAPQLDSSSLCARMHLSIHHPFLNSFSESITLVKPLLSGRYWARCQGRKENKKQFLSEEAEAQESSELL